MGWRKETIQAEGSDVIRMVRWQHRNRSPYNNRASNRLQVEALWKGLLRRRICCVVGYAALSLVGQRNLHIGAWCRVWMPPTVKAPPSGPIRCGRQPEPDRTVGV